MLDTEPPVHPSPTKSRHPHLNGPTTPAGPAPAPEAQPLLPRRRISSHRAVVHDHEGLQVRCGLLQRVGADIGQTDLVHANQVPHIGDARVTQKDIGAAGERLNLLLREGLQTGGRVARSHRRDLAPAVLLEQLTGRSGTVDGDRLDDSVKADLRSLYFRPAHPYWVTAERPQSTR
ncbi:hypothetical protein CP978_10925 [Streptomyces nodosus]|uniref:Uncharacterized protein n=1 Tax=Streptomyces nodosus TaxID=40318 RepID=A0A0B5DGZ7_9ACTN|nr:hypothetical protein SNOD_10590 [Streptomyces nodosus]QEV39008.1 hypothetical protein CP978_10925 [Streptomyces nodosus]